MAKKERIVVIYARLAFALDEDQALDGVYDIANCMLIPVQREHDEKSAFIDYQFHGKPRVSPTPVENYDRDAGFE